MAKHVLCMYDFNNEKFHKLGELYDKGVSFKDISLQMKMSLDSTYYWIHRWEDHKNLLRQTEDQ